MSESNALDGSTDPFRPPKISTIVHCLHCNEEYDSYRIEWRVDEDARGESHGFWCCPIEGCDGKGFGFDIFPIDPEYCDEHGNKMWMDDDDDESDDEEWDDEDAVGDHQGGMDESFDGDSISNNNGNSDSHGEDQIDEEDIPW